MVYYAVKVGRKKGIYGDWNSCHAQIDGFKHAKFKKFKIKEDAENYINNIEDAIEKVIDNKNIVSYIYYNNFPGFLRPFFKVSNWKKYYYLFTDGSHRNKDELQFKSGYGIYTFSPDVPNIVNRNNGTNNYCELSAIAKALELILEINEKDDPNNELDREYMIVSDSQYCLRSISQYLFNWILNGWKRDSGKNIHHLEIWHEIYRLLRKLDKKDISVGFMHVKSHKKKPDNIYSFEFLLWYGNQCADKLALGKLCPSAPFGFKPFN